MASSAYKEAVKHFNRVGGQLKRKHDIDPADYLQGVTTKKGVERALEQMRLDAEQMDVDFRLSVRDQKDAAEEAEKEADLQAKEEAYKNARESLEENWGIDMDSTESEIFWNAFNDTDIIDAFGSENVLYMGEEIRSDKKITMRQAAEIAKGVASKVAGGGGEDQNRTARNMYNQAIIDYREMRYGSERLSHADAITRLFE